MTSDQVGQIIETIKTLNLNINEATTLEIANQVLPVVKMHYLYKFVEMGSVVILLSCLIFGIMYMTQKQLNHDNKS